MAQGSNANEFKYFEDVKGAQLSSDLFSSHSSSGMNSTQQTALDIKNVLVYEPESYDDVEKLIDYLKSRQPAIINLDRASPETAQRVLDFTSGATYALSGSVVRIAGNIFLLSPEGVGITLPQELKR